MISIGEIKAKLDQFFDAIAEPLCEVLGPLFPPVKGTVCSIGVLRPDGNAPTIKRVAKDLTEEQVIRELKEYTGENLLLVGIKHPSGCNIIMDAESYIRIYDQLKLHNIEMKGVI